METSTLESVPKRNIFLKKLFEWRLLLIKANNFVAQEFAFSEVFNNFPIYNSFKLFANYTLEADGSIL